jgi:prepilin-type processing-associated H-X9-DG protein
MGMGATNTLERVNASIGALSGVTPEFGRHLDVANAGVLLAVPALLSCGLLRNVNKHFVFPAGYYTLEQLFLIIAFLALCRIRCFERLRYCSPGEWGKVLGLDRIPEVKTLREKVSILSLQQKAPAWSAELCKEWMGDDPQSAGVLYVDGHVRVYHGARTKLPRHYVARQRLCLRATVDYWVNAMDGKPFFRINQAIDPGLLTVLREEIVPILLEDVPGQPSEEQLCVNPFLHRFTLIVDREGYSPEFFHQMWQKRIAVTTYHKFPGPDWAPEEFIDYPQSIPSDTVRLAERGTRLSNGMWVREIRKLSDGGHQTAILSTDYLSDLKPVATGLFLRWCQENFFKYMRENYNLDRLINYDTEPIPDTTRVVNPRYREISGKLRSVTSSHSRLLRQFGALHLHGDIEAVNIANYERDKVKLQEQIEHLQRKIEDLKKERSTIPAHVTIKDLPDEERFDRLSTESKHLVDTIKLIAYRAESAMASAIKEHIGNKDEARRIVQRICTAEGDIIPDKVLKTLTVRLHHQTCLSQDRAVKKLCEELNETETLFPGTDLKLVFELSTTS